jgi:hypothetical protein
MFIRAVVASLVLLLSPLMLLEGAAQLGDYASHVASLGPIGYWRLGETNGASTMTDLTVNQIHGTYNYPGTYLRQLGAPNADRDTAVLFSGGHGEIPDRPYYSLTRDWDRFVGSGATGTTWGTLDGGGAWVCDVSCGSNYYRRGFGEALIEPASNDATYQQGRAITMLSGEMQVAATWSKHAAGGPFVPVALVAQRVDNSNFVRAELVEDPNTFALTLRLVKKVAGSSQVLASAVVGFSDVPGATYWLVRFRFDGNQPKARAWPSRFPQPSVWQVEATQPGTPNSGRVAIRSVNSGGTARPTVKFTEFQVQHFGFSVSFFIKIPYGQDLEKTFPFGKGQHEDGWGDDIEYYFRYHKPLNGEPNHLKGYVFNLDGGKGAGVDASNLLFDTWYHVVWMLDPGDYRDPSAGVHMYINGRRAGGAPAGGATYQGSNHCVDKCIDYSCTNQNGETKNCWNIVPLSGGRSVTVGRVGTGGNFTGYFDELAIFNRKVEESEIKALYNSSCQPVTFDSAQLGGLTATVSSHESNLPQFVPTNAVDNSIGTRWSSDFNDNEQITINLGSVRVIARIRLVWETAYAATYDVKVSNDGINWAQIVRQFKYNSDPDLVDIYRTAQYIRMQGVTRATPWGYSLWEFDVFPCDVAP